MRKAWRLFVRVIFWSYERGSLPYDLMVIAILIFVLLTPRGWYHDQPGLGSHAARGRVRLVDMDPAGHSEVFRVDASLLAPPPAPDLEKETHSLLSRNVPSLHGQVFQIIQIQPVRTEDGTIVGYDVRIKASSRPDR